MIDVLIPTYKRQAKLSKCIESLCNSTYKYIRIIILPDLRRLWCMRLMNEGFKLSTADCVLPISDDIEVDNNTLEIAYKCMTDNYPDFDGIIGIRQRKIENETGLLLIGKKFLARFPEKQAFCPVYKGLYCDTELAEYAKELGKFTYCPDAVVTHYHPAVYRDMKDETHDIGREHKSRDIQNWERRRDKGYLWGRSFDL